jgi:hypothetical protein
VNRLDEPLRGRIKRRRGWIKSDAYKDAIDARDQVREVLPRIVTLFGDKEFIDLLRFAGVQSRPVISGDESTSDDEAFSGRFGRDTLRFLVAWTFLSPLLANPMILAYFSARQPQFVSDLHAAAEALRRHGFFIKSSG